MIKRDTALTTLRKMSTPSGALKVWGKLLGDAEISRAIDENPTPLNELGYDPWGYHPESAKILFSLGKMMWGFPPRG